MPGIAFAPGSTGISAARRSAAAAVAALALAGIAGAAPTWTGPVALSSAERVVSPDVAQSAAGDAIVVWNREEGEVCATAPENPACKHIVEAISRDPGATSWQSPVALAEPGVGSGPRAAVDSAGNAVVVWSHDVGEPRFLQASYRRARGGPWDSPIDLSDDRFRAGTQQVAIDGAGNVVAAWARSGPSGLVAQAAVRSASSGIWGPPVDLSRPDAAVAGPPSLAVGSGGNALVGWVLASGVVQAAAWSGSWHSPVDLGSGAAAGVDVALSASGDAVVVWTAGAVVRAAFRPAGSGWTGAADVASSAHSLPAPQVALDPAGNAHAVWVGGAGTLQASARARASGAWSPPVALSAPNREATAPQLAVDAAGNAVAVWTDAGATRGAIRPAQGTWQPPNDLSRPNEPTRDVRVAFGRVGAALAVWSRLEPGRVRMEGSDLGGSGPVVGPPSVPERVIAGAPAPMSVGAWPWAAALAGEPAWDFGDGASARGANVRHAFARPGRYTVVVTQADTTGATSTATAGIVVAARAVQNLRRPTIQGPPRVGATLTCNRGVWTGTPPIRYVYRWLRTGGIVPAARSPRFRVRSADRGALLACRVTARNVAGSRSAVSRPVRIRRR